MVISAAGDTGDDMPIMLSSCVSPAISCGSNALSNDNGAFTMQSLWGLRKVPYAYICISIVTCDVYILHMSMYVYASNRTTCLYEGAATTTRAEDDEGHLGAIDVQEPTDRQALRRASS